MGATLAKSLIKEIIWFGLELIQQQEREDFFKGDLHYFQ